MIRKRTVKSYKPEKIILFGSHAYGRPNKHSDFDFPIIKRTRRRDVDRIRDVSRIFGMRDFSLDVIVRTLREMKERLKDGNFFCEEILTKARVIYEKS
jgi:predicted nucleotidyltransferase